MCFLCIIKALRAGIRRAILTPMYPSGFSVRSGHLLLILLAGTGILSAGQSFLRTAAETNVNQRYTIESISVAGVRVENAKLPSSLRHRLSALVGARCDVAILEDLAGDLRKELHLNAVSQHLSRGSEPGRIRVNFEVIQQPVAFDISVPKFLYHSAQGWTGELDAITRIHQNTFTFGAVSNGDDLVERNTGVVARYEDAKVGSEKVHFALQFENYSDEYSQQTRAASPNDIGLYRRRRNIAPELTVAVAKTLTLSAGLSFQSLENANPLTSVSSANAFTGEVRYGHKIEGDTNQQTVNAVYSLRAGTRSLGSDYSYARHLVTLRYEFKAGRQTASDELMAGGIVGQAPLFERFSAGNSTFLRGWERSLIDPLGAARIIHNTVSWSYQLGDGSAEAFYDAGTFWTGNRQSPVRHSVGAGYRQGIFFMTMAFPLIEGKVMPVFMAGMNY